MPTSFQVTYLDRAALLSFVATVLPADVTVTGRAGAGYLLVTDVLGEDIHKYDLNEPWTTKHLLLMRNIVSEQTAAVLCGLGLEAEVASIPLLTFGTAILVTT